MSMRSNRFGGLRLSGFDWVVLLGGLVNLAVICLLLGYWLVNG